MLGGELVPCSLEPLTGFYRNGCCETGPELSISQSLNHEDHEDPMPSISVPGFE